MTQPTEQPDILSLMDCPPGLFLFNGTLAFKTEYGASIGKDVGGGKVEWTVTHWPEAYVVASGEFFWGGAKSHEERAKLLVEPVDADRLERA